MDYGIRSGKSLSLGMTKASPLSSSFIGNFTWSYIFIYHMICVFLGASIYFVRICLLLFIKMFCIFLFNKNVKYSLCHAYLPSILVAVWKQKVYRCCKNSLEDQNVIKCWNILHYMLWIILLSVVNFKKFLTYRSMILLAFFRDCPVLTNCCYVCIVCICLLV